jgi:hypothetical protein
MSVTTLLLSLAALMQTDAQADQPSALERFQQQAQGYEMRLADRRKSPLELSKQPILHWNNPAANDEDGAVFVWLLDGRPEVIGTMFTLRRASTGETVLKHSLHSLSGGPLTADHQGQRVWAPSVRGVEFHAVADAPEPAESSRLRLIQMKALAKDFSGKIVRLNGKSSELRLLPQPLVRYEPKRPDVVDGAIFALAEGTDPQALVLIEARKADGAPRWEFAFARFHFVTLYGYHKQQEVWRVDADPSQMNGVLGDPQQFAKVYISLLKK